MYADLSFLIEASSMQKATALRDGCAEWLEAHDCKVINRTASESLNRYTVYGVDTTKKEPFADPVEAETADDAKVKVASKTKIVSNVAQQ
jgi:glycerol dehydrogenase-like iron-containing ADH family enzyme